MASSFLTGRNNERRAVELFEKEGWVVYKPTRSRFSWKQNVDVFGLYDLIAVKCGEQPRFIQVKTGGISPLARQQIEWFQAGYLHSFCVSEAVIFKKIKNKWVVFKRWVWR